MNKKILVWMIALISSVNLAHAGYNANMVGEVESVLTYPAGLVLFRLKNQPVQHPACNPMFFAIATDVKDVAVNRMLSRLLTAYTTKIPVNIGFDDAGGCGNGYIRTHRVG